MLVHVCMCVRETGAGDGGRGFERQALPPNLLSLKSETGAGGSETGGGEFSDRRLGGSVSPQKDGPWAPLYSYAWL